MLRTLLEKLFTAKGSSGQDVSTFHETSCGQLKTEKSSYETPENWILSFKITSCKILGIQAFLFTQKEGEN